ncbi:hypothetical protein [Synechococcus sp. BA-132 BA5]|uniref:hypothetical protein n=1 Tax=Synechococcus sp. BA-132 BA5 TaxID=3110252 RepID=UPI002B20CB7B|nr:hypothetical protein [Synechococcus sp. BA-132 BA5]MEA5415003.1 hypothetical protein [Synechococcus sp. BA-132 BA5]
MATSLLVPAYRRNIQSLFRDFLLPVCKLAPAQSKSLQRVLIISRLAVLGAVVVLMLVTQLLTATVFNWDANWYKLARIPAMIIEHSVFPENTGSLVQLLHPIGHDLLYLPDITVLSLRGMGLIACLEFLVILGCLYQISLLILSSLSSQGRGVKTQYVLLLVTVLFVSSDLQVLQSADPKNDLVIVMTFVISLLLSIEALLRREEPLRYILSILLVLIYSIAAKAYGFIVLIPPFLIFIYESLRLLKLSSSPWIYACKSLRRHVRETRAFLLKIRMPFMFILLNTLIITLTYVSHSQSVANSEHAQQLTDMAAKLSNVTGSLSDRLTIFGLNASRNFIAFVLYPYSTLLKWNAKAPDDYLFGFGPLTSLMNDPRGLVNASAIVRTIKADSAFGSIFFVPLMIVLVSLFSRKLMRSRLGVQDVSLQLGSMLWSRVRWIHMATLIGLSCLLVFLFFSYALLGQSFGSKFMGATYVPLIPLLSVGFAELFCLKSKLVLRLILLASLYAIIRSCFLLDVSVISNFVVQLVGSPASLAVNQSPNLLYYQYLGSRSDVQETNRWLAGLSRLSPQRSHVLCFGSETPSLTPLMHAIQSFNQGNDIDIRLSSHDQCIPPGDRMIIKGPGKEVDYIYLP